MMNIPNGTIDHSCIKCYAHIPLGILGVLLCFGIIYLLIRNGSFINQGAKKEKEK